MNFDRAILVHIQSHQLFNQPGNKSWHHLPGKISVLCVWLSSCSAWWQATLETNYHAVVAQHKTSVWIRVCVANVKFCCDAWNSLHFEFRSKLFDVICRMWRRRRQKPIGFQLMFNNDGLCRPSIRPYTLSAVIRCIFQHLTTHLTTEKLPVCFHFDRFYYAFKCVAVNVFCMKMLEILCVTTVHNDAWLVVYLFVNVDR